MSKKYKPHVYLLRTLTNLHVGGGSNNYDYIDKQVQRDPTTNNPTIFSSSLKGAIRDYMAENGLDSKAITHIFGNEPSDNTPSQGAYRFLSADLLAIPRPSEAADKAFDLIASPSAKNTFSEKVTLMGGSVNLSNIDTDSETAFHEVANQLPVLSRNHLDNGVSQNLWYEEVVPRESLFGFVILAPDGDVHFEDFNAKVENNVIQIGANATIGYGLCHFKKIAG